MRNCFRTSAVWCFWDICKTILDFYYTFTIDLTPNRIPFGVKSFENSSYNQNLFWMKRFRKYFSVIILYTDESTSDSCRISQNQIVITVFQLIWNQTKFCLCSKSNGVRVIKVRIHHMKNIYKVCNMRARSFRSGTLRRQFFF